jgi:hypothetical protein
MRIATTRNLIAILCVAAVGFGCSDDGAEDTSSTTTTSNGAGGSGSGGDGGDIFTTGNGAGGTGGGAGVGGSAGGNGGSGGIPTGAPGELTIEIVDLAGADGKTVIVSALEGQTKVGGICVELSGDPASATETVGDIPGSNPCNVGSPVELSGGLVTLRGGLYSAGVPAPEMCLAQNVVVDGDTTVTLGAFQACQ